MSRCQACDTLFTTEEILVADDFCRKCLDATYSEEDILDYDEDGDYNGK